MKFQRTSLDVILQVGGRVFSGVGGSVLSATTAMSSSAIVFISY